MITILTQIVMASRIGIDSNDTFAGGISNDPIDQDSDGAPDYRDPRLR